MGVIPWRWICGVFVALTATAICIAPDPKSELVAASGAQLLQQLASSEEVKWQPAQDEILARGNQILPECVEIMHAAPTEVRQRLFYVLEQWYLSSDEQVADAASEALEDFSEGPLLEVSMAADRLLNENALLRNSKALFHLQELGGEILAAPGQRADSPISAGMILLGDRWEGGDAGLRFLLRLSSQPQLHVSQTAGVSEAAIRKLMDAKPRLYVVRPDQGCLGVEGFTDHFGFCVVGVGKDSPAARGGLQAGDVIIGLADDPRTNEEPVPLRVGQYPPGWSVPLFVRRGRNRITVNVELGSAFAKGQCACEGEGGVEATAARQRPAVFPSVAGEPLAEVERSPTPLP